MHHKRNAVVLLIFSFCASALLFAGQQSPKESSPKVFVRIYDADKDKIFENLHEKMRAAAPGEKLSVIILYKEQTPLAGSFAVRLNSIPGIEVKRSYNFIPAVAARMTTSQINQLRSDPWVQHVELDAKVRANLNTARTSFGVTALKLQFGFTGDGDGISGNYSKNDMVIAIADTGVNADHLDLRGKILYWKDFIQNRPRPYDDLGHGTHVAGVAVGAGKKDQRYAGVAPEAALVVFKVLDDSGSGDVSTMIAAIEELIAQKSKFNIRIFNLSLNVPGSRSDGKDAFSRACNAAVANGIVTVVSAGNDGPFRKSIGSPAAAARVITVGAGADLGEGGFYLAHFSSRGPTVDGRTKPDLWGPGVRVRSPALGGGYSSFSGTSFSAPFVSGIVALMLQANPKLTPQEIKFILINSAQKWVPEKENNQAGAGRLQAYAAVTQAAGVTAGLNPPKIPELSFLKTLISPGETQRYTIPVQSLKFPVAITAIMRNLRLGYQCLVPFPILQLELISPSGKRLAWTWDDCGGQATLTFRPTTTGQYILKVKSLDLGINTYILDISADTLP